MKYLFLILVTTALSADPVGGMKWNLIEENQNIPIEFYVDYYSSIIEIEQKFIQLTQEFDHNMIYDTSFATQMFYIVNDIIQPSCLVNEPAEIYGIQTNYYSITVYFFYPDADFMFYQCHALIDGRDMRTPYFVAGRPYNPYLE